MLLTALTLTEKDEIRRFYASQGSITHSELAECRTNAARVCGGTPRGSSAERRDSSRSGAYSSSGSMSWIQRFKKRYGIKRIAWYSEAASVDLDSLPSQRKDVAEIIEEFEPRDEFNSDETALYYRLLPNQTIATKSFAGHKKDKTSVSVGLCCNIDGIEKLNFVLINKSKSPRCFKGVNIKNLPLHYFWNRTAWMERSVFCAWLRSFDAKMHGRKVLLLLDHASIHVDIELINVCLHFLPPRTTSHLQSFDAGIIRSFKAGYRKRFIKWHLANTIKKESKAKHTDMLSAIHFMVEA